MSALAGLAALPYFHLLSLAAVDVRAEVTSEVAAGEAPLVAGQEPSSGLASSLTARGELQLRAPGAQLQLEYAPRLHWRLPAPGSRRRPLLLHQSALAARAALSQTTILRASSSLSAGEADYTSLPELLGSSQGALPGSAEMVLATAGLAVDQELSRTSTLSTEVQLLHRRPLDTAPADPAPDPAARLLLARQSSAQLDLRLQTRLGLRDTLTAETSFAYERHTPGLELGWWQPQLTWQRRLAREHALSLAAGLVLTRSLTTSADVRSPDGLSPVGQLAYDGLLVRSRHHPLRSLLSLQVEHWIDPVLQTAGPRALLSARLILVATPRLTLSLDGRFAASLQRHPLPGSPDETLAAASLPLQYRASERITLETGVRWSDRAPHLRASPFDWHQRELWYYVTLTAAASTVPTPRPGPQLSP